MVVHVGGFVQRGWLQHVGDDGLAVDDGVEVGVTVVTGLLVEVVRGLVLSAQGLNSLRVVGVEPERCAAAYGVGEAVHQYPRVVVVVLHEAEVESVVAVPGIKGVVPLLAVLG